MVLPCRCSNANPKRRRTRNPSPKQEAGALARPYAPKSRRAPRVSTPVPNSSATAQRMRATIGGAGRRGGAALSASYWAAAGAVARRRAKLSALAILVDFFCVALREAWCAARCGAQCGAHALGRRPRPLVAGWHVRCGGPDVWARAARARSSSAAGGTLPRAALRGGVRAPERHERALEGRRGGCIRGVRTERREAAAQPSFGAPSQGCALRRGAGENPQWRAQPAGARKKNDASIHRDEQCCSVRLSDSTCSGTVKHGDRYLSCARPWSGAAA